MGHILFYRMVKDIQNTSQELDMEILLSWETSIVDKNDIRNKSYKETNKVSTQKHEQFGVLDQKENRNFTNQYIIHVYQYMISK